MTGSSRKERPGSPNAVEIPDANSRIIDPMTDPDQGASTSGSLSSGGRRRGDTVFRLLTSGSGLIIVVAIVLIGLFLLIQAIPSLRADMVNFFTSSEFNT